MTKRNTLTKGAFIFDHLVWGGISLLWFNRTLFRVIEGTTFHQSRLLLLCGLAISIVLGVAITWEKRRNYVSLLVNLLIPYEVYTLVVYWHTSPTLFWGLLALALLLSVIYVALVFEPKIKTPAKTNTIIRARLKRAFFGTRTLVAGCLSVFLFVLWLSSTFGILVFAPSVEPSKSTRGGDVGKIENHIEVIQQLKEERWVTLSNKEKLNILQVIADTEANRLGLPHELNVIAGALSENQSEKELASYNDRTHVITIDIAHLETSPALEILNSVCHEARHSYQHALCKVYENLEEDQKDLALFKMIPAYEHDFSRYIEGKDAPIRYYYQWVEIDARSYADDAVDEYTQYLEKDVA